MTDTSFRENNGKHAFAAIFEKCQMFKERKEEMKTGGPQRQE